MLTSNTPTWLFFIPGAMLILFATYRDWYEIAHHRGGALIRRKQVGHPDIPFTRPMDNYAGPWD